MQEAPESGRKVGWWSRLVGTAAEVEAARSEAEEIFKGQQREIARLEEALVRAGQLHATVDDRARGLERELEGVSNVAARHAELQRQAEAALSETQQRLSGVEAMFAHLREESGAERRRFEELRNEWGTARADLEARIAGLQESAQESARKAESQRMAHLRDLESLRIASTRERARAEATTAEVRAALSDAVAKVHALQEELGAERRKSATAHAEAEARAAEAERKATERAAVAAAEYEKQLAQWRTRAEGAQSAEAEAKRRTASLLRQAEAAGSELAALRAELAVVKAAEVERCTAIERLRAELAEVKANASAGEQAAAGQIELLSATVATERERAAAAFAEAVRLGRDVEELRGSLREESARAEASQRRQEEEKARAAELATRVRMQQFDLDALRSVADDLSRERDDAQGRALDARRGGGALLGVALDALRLTLGPRASLPLRTALNTAAASSPEGPERFYRGLADAGWVAADDTPAAPDALAARYASTLLGA